MASRSELLYAPKFVKGVKLGVNGSFNHAEITKTTAPFAQVGQTLEDVPERTVTVSVDYDTPIVNDWSGFAHVDYDFTGHSHGAFQTFLPNYENKAYGVVNAQLGVDTDIWKIYLFAKICSMTIPSTNSRPLLRLLKVIRFVPSLLVFR